MGASFDNKSVFIARGDYLYIHIMQRPAPLDLDYFRYGNGDVDVHRRIGREWVLWVIVRDSVVLGRDKGLFAARAFRKDDFIGRYVGRILGKASDPLVAQQVERTGRTPEGDALFVLNGYSINGRAPVQPNAEQLASFGHIILRQPDWEWPGVYAHICNDARGMGRRNNCTVTPGGYMHATRSVPGYRFDVPHDQNAAS
jgi:hypothetical protein